jgi:histidinol-phosphate/aromatic aminotransferase/cobyric acid decarboxylase-like protein/choline kinase
MQAMILAAGMGRRLGKITENKTKGMIEVNGTTLLERSLEILTSFQEIERIVLVVGFAKESVKDVFGNSFNGREIIYIENPDYDKTNNIYSLYLAKEMFGQDDTILLESDLIFERSLIGQLLESHEKDQVLVSRWKSWMDGTVVTLSETGNILQFIPKEGFNLSDICNYYKTVNIYKFSKEFINGVYIPFLSAYCKAFGHNEYYENILGVITFINKSKLKAEIIEDNRKWYEIDDHNDLDIAQTLFSNDADTYLKRYGGFWRFTELKDFCYLVNPYFPPKAMLQEFKMIFNRLIAEYPSTSSIQRKLASDMFDCSPESILVGNGASELIVSLLSVLDYNKIGIPVPTFHEYVARSNDNKIKYFTTNSANFRYGKEEIIAFSDNIDTMVIVNPDNPTGNFIPKKDLLEIVEHFKKERKTLVIDESFVDFADKNERHTLITDEIIDKFPNLVVIKSIGKSYGVPGCRLGVLASGNRELVNKIQKFLPVWNISSIGEFFLQTFHKYKEDYFESVGEIIFQREKLFKGLSSINFLRPIPSGANYILCEVTPPYSCGDIAKKAIEKNILIKDCSDKLGFEGKSFVRVTVRGEEDNIYFLDFLKSLDL